jgi:hypothetical protein
MQIQFRPLPNWPYKPTKNRPYCRFKTPYPVTLELLRREVEYLGGRDVVMGVGLEEKDLRLDGTPRAGARAMSHPGVEISFDSRDHGRQTYATDQFDDWQDNVRAVALSLEALRAVERYGVSKGRQYTGFALLSAGPGLEEHGRQLVERFGSIKEAIRHTHPDTGDAEFTPREYQAVITYRDAQRAAGQA